MERRLKMNFDQINSQLLSHLEKGGLFWRKPFQKGIPRNYFSKRPYSGINNLLLCQNDYSSPFYASFLQLKEHNLQLKKGSKADKVIFWKLLEYNTEEELRRIPFLTYHNVFNISLVEGISDSYSQIKIPGEKFLSAILEKFNIRFRHTLEGEAYYSPSTDSITMPNISCFNSPAEYLSTFFHEISHWCLHNNRIPRKDLNDKYRDYAFEELIAELSACYLCSYAGIEYTFDNSAAYLDNWLSLAKLNKYFFYRASFYSQKIIQFLLPALVETPGEKSKGSCGSINNSIYLEKKSIENKYIY